MKAFATFLALVLAIPCAAQGPETPPGPPGPTQRSVGEIWDALAARRSALEANQALLDETLPVSESLLITLSGLAAVNRADDTTRFDFFTLSNTRGVGESCIVEVLPSGEILAAGLDPAQSDLIVARNVGGPWTTDTASFNAAGPLALGTDENGNPRVFFARASDFEPFASTFISGSWTSVSLAPPGPTLAVEGDGPSSLSRQPTSGRSGLLFIENGQLVLLEEIPSGTRSRVVPTNGNILSFSLAYSSADEPRIGLLVDPAPLPASLGVGQSLDFLTGDTAGNTWVTTTIAEEANSNLGFGGTNLLGSVDLDSNLVLSVAVETTAQSTIEVNGVTVPAGGFERVRATARYDVSSLPATFLGYETNSSSGAVDDIFLNHSKDDESYGDLSYDGQSVTWRGEPVLRARPFDQPVQACAALRSDGRAIITVLRPFEGDWVVAIEKP